MMEFIQFDYSDDHYQKFVAIRNHEEWFFPMTVSQYILDFERAEKKHKFYREFAYIDGVCVGGLIYGDADWCYTEGKRYGEIFKLPDYNTPEIEEAMMARLLENLYRINPTKILVMSKNIHPVSNAIIESHGFQIDLTDSLSQVDLSTFDVEKFKPSIAKVESTGIELLSFLELVERYEWDWLKDCHRLAGELLADVPASDPLTLDTFEEYADRFKNTKYNRHLRVFALEDGKFVGSSSIVNSIGNDEYGFCGLAGVVRSHRRRGIARALKVKAHINAIGQGMRYLTTENEENNPMLDLNVELGYRPFLDRHHYIKQIA